MIRNSETVPQTQHPLSLAKIAIPRLPRILHRKHPYDLLQKSLDSPCVWITGPAGSGKTTLAAGFITEHKFPYLWYQLDGGDTDMATFFYYMGLAAKRLIKTDAPMFPVFSAEYTHDIKSFSRRFFEALCFHLSPHSIIVLDDYQEVGPESSLNQMISQAMATLPKDINLFILSRELPPADFSRAKANQMIHIIGWNHIRLTEKETSAIASLQVPHKLPKTVVPHLHRMVGGWVAGLILMLSGEGVKRRLTNEIPYEQPHEIFDYLAREAFDNMEGSIQDLLTKTALFPHVTGAMAEKLTGLPHAERIFSSLHRKHLFIEKREDHQDSYRYHPLFRDFLLARLQGAYSGVDLAGLRYRAAMILDEAGQHEAAISQLCRARYWEDAARMMEKHAASLVAQGRTRPLGEWLDQLPVGWFDRFPWLHYWRGACHLSFEPSTARACYIKAFERFRALGEPEGIFLAWSGIVESVFYALEGFSLLDHWIEVFEGLVQGFPVFPSEEIEARVTFGIFSALTFRQPHHPQMRLWADRALKLADTNRHARAKAYAYTQLIFYHVMMGNHGTAAAIVEAAEQLRFDAMRDPLVRIDLFAIRASYFQNLHHHGKCLETVFEGLSFSAKTGVRIMDQMFLGWGAWSAIDANDMKTAAELLDRLGSEFGPLRPHENSLYHFLRSREAIVQGNFQKAVQHGNLSLNILQDLGIPINICMVHLSMARAMHGLGRTPETEDHLERAQALAGDMRSPMLLFSALLLKAAFALDQKSEDGALGDIQTALLLGKKKGFYVTSVARRDDLIKIFNRALDAGILVEYVRRFILERSLLPEDPYRTSAQWPWPVRVTTLGGFNLIIREEPFGAPGRGPQKTLNLFKLLIASGKNGISEAHIQDILWPEMDGDRAHNIFTTTVHRLRKILGNDKAISVSRGKIAISESFCWVDAFHFQEYLKRAQKAFEMEEEGAKKAALMMEKAVAIYRGPFLPDDDEPRAIPLRQRLSMEFRECVHGLGRYYEQEEQWQAAIRCYTRGISVDPLVEGFYQDLMGCYLKTGKPSEAKRTYMQCRETLTKVLGVEPSKDMKALSTI